MALHEVERLLDTPKLDSPFGLRDKAMLELLYATGIRVSEMIELKLSDVHLTMGFVRCFGKGRKERIVPIGEAASHAIEAYIEKPEEIIKEKRNRSAFSESSRQADQPSGVLEKPEKIALEAGIKRADTAYAPALFCNAPA